MFGSALLLETCAIRTSAGRSPQTLLAGRDKVA